VIVKPRKWEALAHWRLLQNERTVINMIRSGNLGGAGLIEPMENERNTFIIFFLEI
jgi:hypothetical protein